MDEYTFISLAKLKADRLRLEREQLALEPQEEPRKAPVETHEQPSRLGWFSRAPQWRAQS
jgi:hypothetical protein